jgi:alpha-tubulin suppressor-like RCC1 family protein
MPTKVVGLPNGQVSAIGAARFSTCAIAAGSVSCWGRNTEGQLGIDTTQAASTIAVAVTGLASDFEQLALAADRACAIRSGGKASCWGHDHSGDLGTAGNGGFAVDDVIVVAEVSTLGIALRHSCSAHAGAVHCWGLGGNGELGDGLAADNRMAVPVAGLAAGVTALSVGGGIIETAEIDSSCVILAGAVQCWGQNDYGQIGDGTTLRALTPTSVAGLGGDAVQISVGGGHVCAVIAPDTIRCWGRGVEGQLGQGQFQDSLVPATVQPPAG